MMNGAGRMEKEEVLVGTFELRAKAGKDTSLYFNTDVNFTALCVSSGGGSRGGGGVHAGAQQCV